MKLISKRVLQLNPSPTLALDAKVKELQSKGIAVVNLGIGEPDFDTPSNIKRAAIEAIKSGFTHYTATSGIIELRKAIAHKLLKDNKIEHSPSEILVGVGSKQLVYNALQALCEKGDEVIVATPIWSTYIEQIRLAEGTPILIRLKPPFKLTASEVKKHISPRTKIILINSPANPTGAIIAKEELEKIAEIAVSKKIWVISDEIYEKILYGKENYISIASLNNKVRDLTITINGFSKAYAMTGWRIGYAAGPKEVIDAMSSLQGQTTSNTSSIAQKAAVEALEGSQKSVFDMSKKFGLRRELVCKALSNIMGLSFVCPEGAFYVLVSVEKLLNKKYTSSKKWCGGLLEKQRVAVVPGEAFLSPGYFRLSFAASSEELKKGIKGIKEFIGDL